MAKHLAALSMTKAIDGKKICIKCGENKPVDQFYLFESRKRLSSECKICTKARSDAHARANRTGRAAAHKKRLAARPEHIKEYKLKYRYGLSNGEYEQILEAQDFKCAICRTDEASLTAAGKPQRFHIDHCHQTNRIRGILCNRCNMGIGGLCDDPKIVRAAAEYLEHYQ